MKDLLISIAILLILAVLFSVYGKPPEQDTALKTETHGKVALGQGENNEILQGNGGDQMQLEYMVSPKTGEIFFD